MAAEIITWASDKILDLLKLNGEINKDRFLNIYEPMFDNLTVVHNFYRKLFNTAINLLPDHFESKENFERVFVAVDLSNNEVEDYLNWATIKASDENGNISRKIGRINSTEYINSIKSVHEIFEKDRIDNLTIRVQLREFATVCLRKIEKKMELQFVWAVVNYFINYKRFLVIKNINDNPYWTSNEIMELIKLDGQDLSINKITDSPSLYISKELFKSNYAPFIKMEIRKVIFELQQFYEEACMRFMELKFERFT